MTPLLRCGGIVLTLSGLVVGQSTADPQTAAPAATAKTSPTASQPAAPSVDPKQKQAVDILQTVEGQLGRFSPETQTYLLERMANAYAGLNKRKQVALLKEAIEAASAITEGDRFNREAALVGTLNAVDPTALRSLQDTPDPWTREWVREHLLDQDIDQGRWPEAVRQVLQWDTTVMFPYPQAQQLIAKLPAGQSGERQAVFAAAIAAYRLADTRNSPDDSMTSLILGSYEQLPPTMIVKAIDLVLSRAAQFDRQHGPVSIWMNGTAGGVRFNTTYDHRAFQLLPVLDKVDPAQAAALRRDHANLAALSNKYPNGPASLGRDLGAGYSSGENDFPSQEERQRQAARSEEQNGLSRQIVMSGLTDFDAALSNANKLNNTVENEFLPISARGEVLLRLAQQAMRHKNMTNVRAAENALMTAIEELPPWAQIHYLMELSALSAQLDDSQTAKQYVGKGMRVAKDLYERDETGDPPNLAPRAFWPSTAAWTGLLTIAARIDQGFALQQSRSIPDPEIEAVVNVGIASALLAQEPGTLQMQVHREGSSDGMTLQGGLSIPWWQESTADSNQTPRSSH